ncbi:MAG: hypothetical protein HYZ53_21340 [Planctomycetes bacterium]|nr:hypothetical protein [Planctomycetota bacterium]
MGYHFDCGCGFSAELQLAFPASALHCPSCHKDLTRREPESEVTWPFAIVDVDAPAHPRSPIPKRSPTETKVVARKAGAPGPAGTGAVAGSVAPAVAVGAGGPGYVGGTSVARKGPQTSVVRRPGGPGPQPGAGGTSVRPRPVAGGAASGTAPALSGDLLIGPDPTLLLMGAAAPPASGPSPGATGPVLLSESGGFEPDPTLYLSGTAGGGATPAAGTGKPSAPTTGWDEDELLLAGSGSRGGKAGAGGGGAEEEIVLVGIGGAKAGAGTPVGRAAGAAAGPGTKSDAGSLASGASAKETASRGASLSAAVTASTRPTPLASAAPAPARAAETPPAGDSDELVLGGTAAPRPLKPTLSKAAVVERCVLACLVLAAAGLAIQLVRDHARRDYLRALLEEQDGVERLRTAALQRFRAGDLEGGTEQLAQAKRQAIEARGIRSGERLFEVLVGDLQRTPDRPLLPAASIAPACLPHLLRETPDGELARCLAGERAATFVSACLADLGPNDAASLLGEKGPAAVLALLASATAERRDGILGLVLPTALRDRLQSWSAEQVLEAAHARQQDLADRLLRETK